MEDHSLHKIAISGPTLASLIQRVSSSSGDVDGLLFGHVTQITHSTLSDDTSSSSASSADSSSHLIATITSFLCFNSTLSFYDSIGHLHLHNHHRHHHNHHLLGWFSARRRTPLRPSMREFSVTSSLSSKPKLSFPITNSQQQPPANSGPSLFLLFTTPLQDQLIHTHEYRAYQFSTFTQRFNTKSIDIVNIGPAFRGHYGNFSPNSAFPLLSCEMRSYSGMNEDRHEEGRLKDQKELDMCSEGFEVRNLSRLMGSEAANYTGGLEDLYEKMLAKIESLARRVEIGSAKILDQEDHNRMLRNKVAKSFGDKNPIL